MRSRAFRGGGRRMRRAVVGLGLAAVFSLAPVVAGTAAAAPPIRITILLSCDRGVDAQATVTLQTADRGTDLATVTNADLNCGPDSVSGHSKGSRVWWTRSRCRRRPTVRRDLRAPARWTAPPPWSLLPGDCSSGARRHLDRGADRQVIATTQPITHPVTAGAARESKASVGRSSRRSVGRCGQ